MADLIINADFPPALECLFRKARYKVLYGGRGGAKSWGAARALLIRATQEGLRVLCAREIQNSIKESVHRLLSDQIKSMGLGPLFDIQRDVIKCISTGAEFFFEGIKHNVDKVKSYEGIDICWVEEAHLVSKDSWDVLIPTIRKAGSEIWITFNPGLKSDETYQRFVVHKRPEWIVKKISWRDNPWFSAELKAEMEHLKERDPDAYLNVWEGFCKQILEGAVYVRELRETQAQGRICEVPYDRTVPVHTFWDLGWADKTVIWFAQAVGFEYHIIDYYENSQQSLDHYLAVVQARGYIYGDDWLPHDARAKQLGTGRSVEELLRSKGRKVRIVPRLSVEDGINAARTLFPQCYFDEEKCEMGLEALRAYRYEVTPGTQTFSSKPLHDWSSHAADGFRMLAVGLKAPKTPRIGKEKTFIEKLKNWDGFSGGGPDSLGWMR